MCLNATGRLWAVDGSRQENPKGSTPDQLQASSVLRTFRKHPQAEDLQNVAVTVGQRQLVLTFPQTAVRAKTTAIQWMNGRK